MHISWDDFSASKIQTNDATIFVRKFGSGPPILLLHGFPQTHLMWREVAPLLASKYTVICADLRGYGASSCPPSSKNHEPYSKRSMAKDMVEVMKQLGFASFAVVGHDRGGRVAYRMALDFPKQISHLAILDIVPTATVWDLADARFALAFWPWSLLAQPSPLPERILETNPEIIIENAFEQWGSASSAFPVEIRNAYVVALKDPKHAHAICEEYRAAATIDREQDALDRKNNHKIACPTLVLWSKDGAVDTWYTKQSGPIAIWHTWAKRVEGQTIEGGHFFPEEKPKETAAALLHFLGKH